MLACSLSFSLSISSLSCAVFSYAQHQQEVFLPCPVRIPLLLQYRCSPAVEEVGAAMVKKIWN